MPWVYRCESCGHDTDADPWGADPSRTCKGPGCHADGCQECIGEDGYCRTRRLCNGDREDSDE